MINNNERYKFKGSVNKCIYKSDSFSVYAFNVDTIKYPNIKQNKYKNTSVCGELHDLVEDVEYEIEATEQETKYGTSYKVINIKRDEPTTAEETYTFLREILTDNQAETIIKNYPNIISIIKEDRLDEIDIGKLKGIGEKSLQKIKEKIIENFYLVDLVSEFGGIISLSMLRKIYDKYSSIEKLKDKLKKEPYTTLTRVSGIGFKKADAIVLQLQKENAIDFGYDVKTSKDRCLSCILYLLGENENNGNTKMNLMELRSECIKIVPECIDTFTDAIKDDSIYYNKETMDIALKSTYEAEKYIAENIKYGLSINKKWNFDWKQYKDKGEFSLSDEQLELLHSVCDNNITILTGGAGCVDCDTEFFDGVEWKRIADYKIGDKVLQYNEDGTAELVFPERYIKNKSDYLWHFKTKYGLNQCLSDNHNCYYITSKGNLYHKTFKEVRKDQEKNGFHGKFITTFDYSGKGINLTDDEIRLMIATFADGSFNTIEDGKNANKARYHIKKDRKKDRLISLAINTNSNYRIINSVEKEYNDIYINVPFRAKHFPKEWYNCNKHQLQVIADEVMFWDGYYEKNNNYATTCKEDADFIQFVYSSLGYRATILIRNRVGEEYLTCGKIYKRKSVEYQVSYTKRTLIGFCIDNRPNREKTKIVPYKTLDGYEYCFTVPSHMLVLRRRDRIFITGNCGKSYSVKALINMLEDNKKTFVLAAPTGKSAKVLKDFSNVEAQTIHRALNFNPMTGWGYNQYCKIPCDVFLIDEFSMVSVEIMKHVIDAIDFDNTKLVMIGDSNQLPSVQCGNLLHDFLVSKIVPDVRLTKIFRYGTGGILTAATDIIRGNQFLPKDAKKLVSIGSDNGYTFIKSDDSTIISEAVALYKKLITVGIDGKVYKPEDVVILTAYNKGDYGAVVLNSYLQKIANKNYGSSNCIKSGSTVYYLDDIVMQRANDYKMQIYNSFDEDECAFVANGECSKVTMIDKDFMVCDFDDMRIKYNKQNLANLSLSYSYTIHKSQGSTIKVVIVISPRSHIYMTTMNLLYVGITRASDRCFHFGLPSTINMAMKKKENFNRNTFMQDMLKTNIDN